MIIEIKKKKTEILAQSLGLEIKKSIDEMRVHYSSFSDLATLRAETRQN